ncbi:MAG: SGNH/GDSL hydrolase family protein [Bacteroidales bacterium]|nr:SGNH/GDSL hydrolase family protein [Bacteroidales bacterium]
MKKKTLIWVLSAVVLMASAFSNPGNDKKDIICWGDSLTAPHGDRTDWPAQLQEMLGDGYNVINGGIAGENTTTIMARQGASPMRLAHDVTIFNSKDAAFKTFIGNNDIETFYSSWNGKRVTPLLQGGWDESGPSQINPCTIGGRPFHLASDSKIWMEEGSFKMENNLYILPDDEWPSTGVLKAGTEIETYAMKNLRGKYANIFFIGQNGGFADAEDLIRQIEAMIDYSGSSRYIVVSYHIYNGIVGMNELEEALGKRFGNHYFNLRNYLITKGLADAGVEPTESDKKALSEDRVPPSLMTDGVHFTTDGYRLIAAQVYAKMQELEY